MKRVEQAESDPTDQQALPKAENYSEWLKSMPLKVSPEKDEDNL